MFDGGINQAKMVFQFWIFFQKANRFLIAD